MSLVHIDWFEFSFSYGVNFRKLYLPGKLFISSKYQNYLHEVEVNSLMSSTYSLYFSYLPLSFHIFVKNKNKKIILINFRVESKSFSN